MRVYASVACNNVYIGYNNVCLLATLCHVTIGMQLMLFVSHNVLYSSPVHLVFRRQCTPVITIGSIVLSMVASRNICAL